jgi:hypothetical protein
MAKRRTIPAEDSAQLRSTVELLGEDTVRQIFRVEGKRLPSRERLANLEKGTGRLTPAEKGRLNRIVRNRNALSRLQESGEQRGRLHDKRKRELSQSYTNRAIDHALKAWLLNGKEPGRDYRTQHPSAKKKQQKAIKALLFLGVDIHSDDPEYGS